MSNELIYHTSNGGKMKYYIIVRNNGAYKVNWGNFYAPNDHKLIIIADKVSLKKMRENGNIKYIDTFISTECFETSNLISIVDGLLAKYKLQDKLESCKIITIGEDDLLPCAQMREHYGISGDCVRDVEVFRDKYLMNQKLTSLQHHLPNHVKFDKILFTQDKIAYIDFVIEQVCLPIFVKPTLNSGSRGTRKINTKEELLSWANEITDDAEYEIDQFLTGDLYHCDSIVVNGMIAHVFVSKYLYPNAESLQSKTLASITLDPLSELYPKVIEFNKNVLDCFKPLQNCCTHLEFFVTPDNQIKFVEIAKRSPGALVPDMYQKQYGIELREIDYKLQMGLPVHIEVKPGPFTGWCFFMNREGILSKYKEPTHFTSEYSISWISNPGSYLKNPTEIADCTAIMLFWNSDAKKLLQDFESLRDYKAYELLPLLPSQNSQKLDQVITELKEIGQEVANIKGDLDSLRNLALSEQAAPKPSLINGSSKTNKATFF
jgi:hypothetical protein